MKKMIFSSIIVALLASNLMAYDANKAEEFNKFYSHMTQNCL